MKVNIALLTVTDTRTLNTDKSGNILSKKIKEAKHNLIERKICKDNKKEIKKILQNWLKKKKIDVIITQWINQEKKTEGTFFSLQVIQLEP